MAGVWAGAALALALTTGCVPESVPSPSPTRTGFASEEEAFAAAEETYRAYVDALNQVDLSDPKTFEPVYALTTGEAYEAIRKDLTTMGGDGWSVSGETRPTLLKLSSYDAGSTVLAVCVDVSGVDLVDMDGNSVVQPDRRDVQSMSVTLERGDEGTGEMLISQLVGRTGGPRCPES